MIIKVLLENTSIREDIGSEHGLSLYIEKDDKKILFDTGASDLFLKNADLMGVDLSQVDYMILSHGHYDHGGGIEGFLALNKKAKLYIHKDAFGDYYARRENNNLEYIGIKKELKNHPQVILTDDNYKIDGEIELFTNIIAQEEKPASNKNLLMKEQGQLMADRFDHEQNLLIEERGNTVLITGCAHNGIVNIIKNFYERKGYMPDFVLGGFHLSGASKENQEDMGVLDKISSYLLSAGGKYYTGHCTGLESYKILKEKMANRIDYLAGGREIEI